MSLDRYLQRGKVNGAGKGLFTLSVTLAFTLASEQVPKQERVSHDRMGKMAAERHRVGLERPSIKRVAPAQVDVPSAAVAVKDLAALDRYAARTRRASLTAILAAGLVPS